jgi:hypothetical protein
MEKALRGMDNKDADQLRAINLAHKPEKPANSKLAPRYWQNPRGARAKMPRHIKANSFVPQRRQNPVTANSRRDIGKRRGGKGQ